MLNNLYIGIDLSLTSTGIIILDDFEILIKKLIKTKNDLDIEDRLLYISDTIFNLVNNYSKYNKIIYIEGLSYNSKNSCRMLELAGLHYLIRSDMRRINLKYEIIPPATLKKFVTGKGNCKKNLIILYVYKKWNIELSDDNLADAYSLARMALDNNTKGIK